MDTIFKFPRGTIRQGGMGFGISTPLVAKTVALLGGYGTVTGVIGDRFLAMVLQQGDPTGEYRRALSHFPFPSIAKMVIDAFYIPVGNPEGVQIRGIPMFTLDPSRLLIALTICANFALVWLAKEGHKYPIGINYLAKVAPPLLAGVTGAVLAEVDFVTVGAGIPDQIPGMMRDIVSGREASYRIPIIGENIKSHTMTFDPKRFFGEKLPSDLKLPDFLPIVSSNLLATILMNDLPKGSVQGFVIEGEPAGGHNAPPRTPGVDSSGAKCRVYGKKDEVDFKRIADLGLPFWIGGAYASVEGIKKALSVGAGIQVGTAFAFAEESGMNPDTRRKARAKIYRGEAHVRTHYEFSPTGFPLKIFEMEGTLSEQSVYGPLVRTCDQGALVYFYERPDGSIGSRCPAEPVEDFVERKGGKIEDTEGRGCLCNALISNTFLTNKGKPPVITSGVDVEIIRSLMKNENDSYSIADVFRFLHC